MLSLLMAATVSRAEEMTAWEMWRAGYEVYAQAEHDKLSGKNSKALAGFQQARDYYQKIKKIQPNWQKSKINERINMCERQITKLLQSMNSYSSPGSVKSSTNNDSTQSTQIYRPKTYRPKPRLPDDDVYRPGQQKYTQKTYHPGTTAPSLNTESDIYRPGRSSSSTAAELAEYRKKYINAQLEIEDLKKQLNRTGSSRSVPTLWQSIRCAECSSHSKEVRASASRTMVLLRCPGCSAARSGALLVRGLSPPAEAPDKARHGIQHRPPAPETITPKVSYPLNLRAAQPITPLN